MQILDAIFDGGHDGIQHNGDAPTSSSVDAQTDTYPSSHDGPMAAVAAVHAGDHLEKLQSFQNKIPNGLPDAKPTKTIRFTAYEEWMK